jgi:cell wall-associated NlpC family hydrolase
MLEGRAEALRERLDLLEARKAAIQERLGYAQDQMSAATTTAITAEQQLATLEGVSVDARVDLAHRVRAIEQSGGAVALYSQAVDASALTDITSNVAALHSVLTGDIMQADDAAAAVTVQARIHDRLDEASAERTRLAVQVQELAAEVDALVGQQRSLVHAADARVAHALAMIERREAAREDAITTWTGPAPTGPTAYSGPAVAAALSVLGSPYVWGAEGPDTFDCSGLVQWSYLQAGLVLPRLASDQYRASTPVPYDQMQPGDLIVYAYDTSDESTIHHIAMYIGNGQMVHAPRTGDVVKVVPVYTEGIIGTVRPGL